MVPERYRGRPEFDSSMCIGCGACVNVCPTQALTYVDDLAADPPTRRIVFRYDTCIFCGNCRDNCTTESGIELSKQWDLAGLDRQAMRETHEYELQLCEKCGASVGTKKHLVWLYEKLGPLAYANPSLLLAKNAELLGGQGNGQAQAESSEVRTSNFMQILCPACKCELNVRL